MRCPCGVPAVSLRRNFVWRDPRWATFSPHCGRFFRFVIPARFFIVLTCIFEGILLQNGAQMEPKWCLNGVTNASRLWWLKEDRFFVRVCLNCIKLRHGCVVNNTVFLGENAHFSEMPRCLVATVLSMLLSRIGADLEAFGAPK